MRYPTKLEAEEWNLLQELTTYNHMDVWFWLCENRRGYDYVYDRENNRPMSLHDAIEQVAEGVYAEDIRRCSGGIELWNSLMVRFNLNEHCVKGERT